MRKSIKSLAIFSVGIAFASCAKTEVFEDNRNALIEQQKNEYRTNYIKKYGDVSETQSWDFSNVSSSRAKTRASVEVICDYINLAYNFWSFIEDDRDQVHSLVKTAKEKDWNPYLAVELYPAFSYGTADYRNKDSYSNLTVCYNNNKTKKIITQVSTKKDTWLEAGKNSTLNHNSGRDVDTRELVDAENVYWAAYTTYKGGNLPKDYSEYKLEKYKEISVNGRTYWCFKCAEDGDYSDLICVVKNVDPVKPIAKRYFIEDLGSKDDFDFNDIVVDVIQDPDGNQKAIIRAMGGTLDFTLKIGDTQWSKSINGVAAGYQVSTMYNTQNTVVWDKVLAEFPVTGWNPETNNISVSMKSIVSNDVIIELPFPKAGEVPMIIAFDTLVDWQKERVSLPSDWWVIPTPEETEE